MARYLTDRLAELTPGFHGEIVIDTRLVPTLSAWQIVRLIIERIISENMDDFVQVSLDNLNYVLSPKTIQRLKDFFDQQTLYTGDQVGSDQELLHYVHGARTITLTRFEPPEEPKRRRKGQGEFFKWYHKLDGLDLSKFQIYQSASSEHTSCFIHALLQAGINQEIVNSIAASRLSSTVAVSDLKTICERYNLTIHLKTEIKTRSKTTQYGTGSNIAHLGLLEEHYFAIDTAPITSYAVKHFDELKKSGKRDFMSIYNAKDKRDPARFIDSFTLISMLLADGRPLLTPIPVCDLVSTPYYSLADDMDEDLTDLETTFFKPVQSKKDPSASDLTHFFDFETRTDENGKHVPYCVVLLEEDETAHEFRGENCGKQLLNKVRENLIRSKGDYRGEVTLIAHNATYDLSFIRSHLSKPEEITKGHNMVTFSGYYYGTKIVVKDSYLLISTRLAEFPKMFGLQDAAKEVISYDFYNSKHFTPYGRIKPELFESYLKPDQHAQFRENLTKWGLLQQGTFSPLEYSLKYCVMDCIVLKRGYLTFRQWMLDLVGQDINKVLTIPSLAHREFISQGCYNGVVEVAGSAGRFIQKCVVGGRVMCANNEPQIVEDIVEDFDGVSLYPSAMERIEGFPMGKPKVIPEHGLNIEWLSQQTHYFVEIEALGITTKRAFPLLSAKDDEGIRQFTNDVVGKRFHLDKIMLEDAIRFQGLTYRIIKGVYFDEGYNPEIKRVIRHLFDERAKLKANKNKAELVYKLIMNAGYGKSIMKPIDEEVKFIESSEIGNFVKQRLAWLVSYQLMANGTAYKVKLRKRINEHANIAQVGVIILSMSKRIMNEVMCLAEDHGVNIYYQDTDSMHMLQQDVPKLSNLFEAAYGRKLVGKDLGQFHGDFSLDGACKNIRSTLSIFLGKKCYYDRLEGENEKGEVVHGMHVRMKGIPTRCVHYTCEKNKTSVEDMYLDLFYDGAYYYDLTEGGAKACFDFHADGTIWTLSEFHRVLHFGEVTRKINIRGAPDGTVKFLIPDNHPGCEDDDE